MENNTRKSPIERAAAQLRVIALAADEGTILGSEDDLIAKLGVSRPTVRQVARLLEIEGVLRTKRGINGGYFASRPSQNMVERVVCNYLDTLEMKTGDDGLVATALWIEVVRKAASLRSAAAKEIADNLIKRLTALPPNLSLSELGTFEQESRSAIFKLIEDPYVELIFRINTTFSREHIDFDLQAAAVHDSATHSVFVQKWRNAKQVEFQAIADGDPEWGMLAARRSRDLWLARRNKSSSQQVVTP